MKRFLVLSALMLANAASLPALRNVGSSDKFPLKYQAPKLINPKTITLGVGRTVTKMSPAQDYIIKCPKTKKLGSTILMGGHNYVVVGCHVTVPKGDTMQRAFYVKGATGIAHFEGVLIDSTGNSEADAWAINAPEAIIQIQRSRVEGVKGTRSGFHGDIIQPWGGAKEIRIDRFTGSSFYQGFQLPDLHKSSGPVLASRVNLASLGPQTSDTGGYLLWVIPGTKGCATPVKATFSDFYVQGREGRRAGRIVYPPAEGHQCPTMLTGDTISFPRQASIKGNVVLGRPPGGDFVPAGSVGLAYDPGARFWASDSARKAERNAKK